MKSIIFRSSFAWALLLASCGDEHQYFPDLSPISDVNPKVKFIHAASDTVGVNLFLGDKKITGNAPSTITTFGAVNVGKVNIGTVTFQNAYPVTNYTTLESSLGVFSAVVPGAFNNTTTFVTKKLSSSTAPAMDASSFYTVALVGTTPAYGIVVFKDDLNTAPLDGNTYLRFANFIHNSVGNLTLRATPPATTADPAPVAITLFQNVAYKDMSGFVVLPRPGTYTNVQIFNSTTNTTTSISTLVAGSSSFTNNKVYTIFARGRIGGTGVGAPGVSRIVNR